MSGNSRPQIAEVLLELNLDKPLDYLIPSDMEGKVQSGSRVEIPLRGGTSLGFVARIKQETDFKTLKSILRHAEASSVEPDLFELALWMSRYYVTPLKKVLKSFLPAAVRKEKEAKQQYVIQKKATQETLAEAARELRQKGSPQAELIDYLLKAPKSPFLSEAMEKTGVLRASVDSLVKKGLVELVKIAVNRSPLEG